MLKSPDNWDRMIFSGQYEVELRVDIAGVRYGKSSICGCRIVRKLFDSFSVGNAVASELDLELYPDMEPPVMAEIKVDVRLRNDDAETDWVPQGTFYIDTRSKDEDTGLLSIVAYDRMLMSEVDYFGGTISGEWPKAAPEVVDEICSIMGVTLDDRTNLDDTLMVSAPVGMTAREVLYSIAAAHGGNWTITAAGKLRLIPLENPPDFVLLGSETGAYAADEFGRKIIIIEAPHYSSPCEGAYGGGDAVSVSGAVLYLDDGSGYTAGTTNGVTLEAWCSFATQELTERMLARVKDIRYPAATISGAICDPCVELNDAMFCGGLLFRVGTIDMDYDVVCTAEIAAPVDGEVEHEYPYQSKSSNRFNRQIAQAKSEIKLTTDSITAQVTAMDGRVAQLRLDLDGISTEVQDQAGNISTLQQTATGLQSQINAVDGRMSEVEQTVDGITTTVSGFDGRISTVEQTVDGVTITTSTGTTYLNGGSFRTEDIMASKIKLGGQMNVYADLDDTSEAGYMGYVVGSISGKPFSGIGMLASEDTAVLGSAVDDVLILSGDDAGIFAGNRIDLHANGHIRVDSGHFRPLADDTTYCGSYSYQWTDGYYQTLHVANSAITTSDRRAKTEIDYDMSKWLHLLDLLKPCTYRRTEGKRIHPGLIAQEVIEAGETAGLDLEHLSAVCQDKESGLYGLRYEEFVPALIAKVQQLEERIKGLEGT